MMSLLSNTLSSSWTSLVTQMVKRLPTVRDIWVRSLGQEDPLEKEWSVLMATPRQASILISEWVSLWDHCMVWGLGLHHARKFLRHLRKPKLARRSLVPFLQSRALNYFPHFYEEISWFFFQSSPPPQDLSTGWAILLPSVSQPPTQYLLTGWEFLGIFQPSPTNCPDQEWVCPRCFIWASPCQYLFYREEAGNLLHHQIKLRISTSMGDLRTRRVLPKFICTPQRGGWVQVATAGTKAPVPRRVQWKKGSPLWVPSRLP